MGPNNVSSEPILFYFNLFTFQKADTRKYSNYIICELFIFTISSLITQWHFELLIFCFINHKRNDVHDVEKFLLEFLIRKNKSENNIQIN